jgi:hypothetical protein
VAAICLFVLSIQAVVVLPISGGVNQKTGERPARQEITKFSNSGPQWDLYVLTMQAIQEASQEEQLSWYQVAGRQFQNRDRRQIWRASSTTD